MSYGFGSSAKSNSDVVPFIIDNKDVVASTAFDVTNPRTGKLQHQSSSVSTEDALAAVDSAQRAFLTWSATRPAFRRDILLKAAEILIQRKEELLDYTDDETAGEREWTQAQLMAGVSLTKDVAGKVSSISGAVPFLEGDGDYGIVIKEPYGVILAIAPWNGPYILGVRNVVLALAAGNTVVLKGSELSPKCFWAVGDVFRQAGLPNGCLNVIYHRPEDAAQVTASLIGHFAVKKIGFTGSTAVGKIIASAAGRHAKPVILELGGKSSCIILDDADLEKAAKACTVGAFMGAGQVCMSTERIIVLRSVAEQFRAAFKLAVGSMYGHRQPSILVQSAAATKVKNLVQDAVSKGGQYVTGNATVAEASNAEMRPVVLENITKEMNIYRDESFGPTVSLFVVDDDIAAVKLANDTKYGLSAGIFTKDLNRGLKLARKIESGAVHINCMTIHDEPSLPHGGVKESGHGRFGGVNGLDEFLKHKSITWRD